MLREMRKNSRPPADVSPGDEPIGEAELVRRCLAGDRAAFERFYRDHRRLVAANLYRVLGDRAELDDLVQEVFVIAFRGMARFRGDSKLSTWLYRVCVNVALGRLRQRSRRPPPVPYADLVEEAGTDASATPAERTSRREDLARVHRALEALPPKKRIVLVLHEIEGLDIKEIAAIVGAPLVTVRTRLHYGKKEFYRRMAAEEEGE